jgi:hypothetical protein
MRTVSKHFWQLVFAILGLLAIFATYNVFLLGRPTKALQVLVDAPVSLVDIRPEAAQDIEVLYRGESVANISLLQVRIKNSGNQPITEADFSRPISFRFAADDKLADVAITDSEPPNVGMVIRVTSDYEAEAEPALLNGGDLVAARFIVIRADSDPILDDFTVDGRIVGVRRIEVITSGQQTAPGGTEAFSFAAAVLGAVVAVLASVLTVVPQVVMRRLRRALRLRHTTDTRDEVPPEPEGLVIHGATYGAGDQTRDVAQILRSKMSGGSLNLRVCNENLGGDPIKGVVKTLTVDYSYAGERRTKAIPELEMLSVPE